MLICLAKLVRCVVCVRVSPVTLICLCSVCASRVSRVVSDRVIWDDLELSKIHRSATHAPDTGMLLAIRRCPRRRSRLSSKWPPVSSTATRFCMFSNGFCSLLIILCFMKKGPELYGRFEDTVR